MRLRTLLIATVLGSSAAALVATSGPEVAVAQKKQPKKAAKGKKGKKAAEKPPPKPGELRKRVRLSPRGARWQMSNASIAKIYDKVFTKQFVPLYKRAGIGPRATALDAELAAKKSRLRKSVLKFGKTPLGTDNGALKNEYTYKNKESMSQLTLRNGTRRHFFFFSNRLWKVYDERKLKKGGTFGKTYKTAIRRLTKKLGVAPIHTEADYEKGIPFEYSEWSDGVTILRVVNREYEKIVGIVYISKSVRDNLPNLRKNKAKNRSKLDKDVRAVTRKGESVDPNKDAAKGYAKGSKKKK